MHGIGSINGWKDKTQKRVKWNVAKKGVGNVWEGVDTAIKGGTHCEPGQICREKYSIKPDY